MSVRRLLQWVLVVQALVLVGLALWFRRYAGLMPLAALGAAAACLLMLRLVVNLNNFLLSAWYASPTPPHLRLSPLGLLRLLSREFWASLWVTSWHMARAHPVLRLLPAAQPVPVLLVHGYAGNSGYWAALRPRLEQAQISYATLDLAPLGADIDSYAAPLQQAIDGLCTATGAAQVALVGHSMGGLALRAWMRAYGSARVARLITLGTPHHGTRLAAFGIGKNVAQMRHGSAWLRALGASEDRSRRALIASLYSHHDNIVAPQSSSQLAGAGQIAFGAVGHVALGFDVRVLDAVMAQLAQVEQQAVLAVRR